MPPTLEELNPELRGLPSFEQARILAEKRRKATRDKLVEQAVRHGIPGFVGAEGENLQFTDPTGIKRTFTPSGDQISFSLPSHMVEPDLGPQQRERLRSLHRVRHGFATGTITEANYKTLYSPQDQRTVEKLYNARSSASADRELNDNERQQFLDSIDEKISKVPRLSPMMREPTAQQKYEASIVKDPVTGQRGTIGNDGKFNPLIDPKIQQARTERRADALDKNLDAEMTADKDDEIDFDVKLNRAQMRTAAQFGELDLKRNSYKPELDTLWENTMNSLDWRSIRQTTSKKMLLFRNRYIENAVANNGVSAAEAGYDFMLRWNNAERNPDDKYNFLVPAFNKDNRRDLMYVATGVKSEGDKNYANSTFEDFAPRKETIDGLRVGEGRVTVDGKTASTLSAKPAPPGMEAVWPNVDDETKADIQRLLIQGKTTPEILAMLNKLGMI